MEMKLAGKGRISREKDQGAITTGLLLGALSGVPGA
jgi:hypothetical protein